MISHTLKHLDAIWACLALTPLTALGLYRGCAASKKAPPRWGVRIRPTPPPPAAQRPRLPRRFSA